MLQVMRLATLLLFAAAPSAAAAHAGKDHGPPGWNFDPWVTVPLALLLILFLVGRSRLARRSSVERQRRWLFLGGWAVLALSVLSPLHEGGEVSFTLHMIEHELIMLVATLLLAASHPGGILAWGLPAPLRRSLGGRWTKPLSALWRRLTEPVTATAIQGGVMWVWHAPALFDLTLVSRGWHIGQHASFIAASFLFWVAMLNPRRGGHLLSATCLFVTSLIGGGLGALMALSNSPWYSAYAAMGVSGIGLDPVTDQQLAGLLMWVPGGLFHAAVAAVLLYRWLTSTEEPRALRAN